MISDSLSVSRRNLLTDEWVMVSPQRMKRPWHGQIEKPEVSPDVQYDPHCYLCPGNSRANDNRNPDYSGPFVFDNDFSALSSQSSIILESSPMFQSRPESGHCRVVCYSDRHDLRMATMSVTECALAITTLKEEFQRLDADENIKYVQVFETRGEMMGCSIAHPHAQVWATENVPVEPAKELRTQAEWWRAKHSPLLADYRRAELNDRTRLVIENDDFLVVVPYWATWPFETLLLPKRNYASFNDMQNADMSGLASLLKPLLSAYDNLFDTSTPYSLGFHPCPSDGQPHPEWIFHAHIYSPLLRSATVRKHLGGFELFGMSQRDLTPEVAAERLRTAI